MLIRHRGMAPSDSLTAVLKLRPSLIQLLPFTVNDY